MSRTSTRRDFMKQAAVASTAWWVSGQSRLWSAAKSPSERIRFACIGMGGKGKSDSADAAKHGDVVAICDVDDKTLDKAAANDDFAKAKRYNDYRKMFDEMADQIDAVTVSIPDNHHASASVRAMKLHKNCFTQKPLTHDIYEARRLAELAREMRVQTQMGNQGTAMSELRRGAALIQAGVIGPVKEVHVWTNRPIWPQGGPRKPPIPVPPNLHWDLWLGPAPERPYAPGYHPFSWRGWWDFGTGALGDMACHTVNLPYMALELKNPVSVEAEHSGHNRDSYPQSSKIQYEYPATDKRPAVTMFWYDGGNKPSGDLLPSGWDVPKTGALFVGKKGLLLAPGDYGAGRKDYLRNKTNILLPEGEIEAPEVEFEESPGHFTEFARAITDGIPARSNFADYSGGLTETILLGNLAIWANKKVEWDAKNMIAKNAPEVACIVKREYRKGWTF